MEVYTRNIGGIFNNGGNIHYVMPHFQRPYSWDEQNWKALLDDIFEIYIANQQGLPREHFMGALVVVNEGTQKMIPTYKLVDGQQRLTTISILLKAVSDLMKTNGLDIYHDAEELLINKRQEGVLRYKLLPTQKRQDRQVYQFVIDNKFTGETDSLIDDAYLTLKDELDHRIQVLGSNFDWEMFFNTIISGLYLVFIEIKQTERPYEIFESLNAKGKALTQTDLVRNYIAMRLPLNEQESAFEEHWSYIDALLDDERTVARIGEMTAFLRHYLALDGQLYNEDAVYQRFRNRMEQEFRDASSFLGELRRLRILSEIYNSFLRPSSIADPDISKTIYRLNRLESTTAYPVLMYLFEAYALGKISKVDLLGGIKVIENYLVRRALIGETQYANRMFPSLIKEIELDKVAGSLKDLLARRRYVTDLRLKEILLSRPVYTVSSRDRLTFIFDEINRKLSEGTGAVTQLDAYATVEHILPQTLSSAWRLHLGMNAERVQSEYLHTLGNLTLLTQSWNSALSNAPFTEKRLKLSSNGLLLNNTYFQREISIWDGDAIRERTEWLVERIISIWPSLVEAQFSLTSESFRRTSPTALIWKGERKEVSSWRDVTRTIATEAWKSGVDFHILSEKSSYITYKSEENKDMKDVFRVADNVYIRLKLNADNHMIICRVITQEMSLREGVDWWVEVEPY